jgi:hypothetical protein
MVQTNQRRATDRIIGLPGLLWLHTEYDLLQVLYVVGGVPVDLIAALILVKACMNDSLI